MISSEFITVYLLKKFDKKYKLSSDGREFIIPSIFLENDRKKHMSINIFTGLWRCFKTGKAGNFVYLYSLLEDIPYRKAVEFFLFQELLEPDQKALHERKPEYAIKVEDELKDIIPLSPTELYKDVDLAAAHEYLCKREIPFNDGEFYVCKDGFYGGRLIIPFKDSMGKIFFFQARALYGQEPKYLNFKGMRASSVLLPFNYESHKPLFICEGVFDALAIRKLGFNATTTLSCFVSKEQMQQLYFYRGQVVVAFDSDEAGRNGLKKFEKLRKELRLEKFWYVFPPTGTKDWNEYIINYSPAECREYLITKPQIYDPLTFDVNEL